MANNSELIQSAYQAFGRGDIPAVIGMLADDVDWSSPATLPQGGQFNGKDGVGKFFAAIGASWRELSLDVESVSDAGADSVVGVVRATGTLQNGSASGYGAAHVFTVRGGKVVRFREYTDLDTPIA